MVEHVIMHAQTDLLEVVRALRLASSFAGALDGGKHQRYEDANDCNYHQKLHECETGKARVSAVWF